MNLSNHPFVWERENSISAELCSTLIQKFEEHPAKEPGRTLHGLDLTRKQSTDLFISQLQEFAEEDRVLASVLTSHVREYINQLEHVPWRGNFEDSGYKIQRTEPGQFFDWHSDFYIQPGCKWVRTVTFIWYLNDIAKGGETEFFYGHKVMPKQGKLLLFPADFSFYHRGNPPVFETKYICTGWLHVPC